MKITTPCRPLAVKAPNNLNPKGEHSQPSASFSSEPSELFDKYVPGIGLGTAASLGGFAYPSTWLHEMGHVKAIELLYKNANPELEVFPFKGGVTRWRPSELTDFGKKLGPNGSRALVSGAGTLVDTAVAMTSFGAGFKMRKKHPLAGVALMTFGGMTVLNSIGYAASAIGGDLSKLAREGHDFASLGVRIGLPPIASVAILASILPAQYFIMRALENSGSSDGTIL